MGNLLDEADLALKMFDGAAALAKYEAVLAADSSDDRAAAGRVRALWLCRRWTEAREQLAALADRTDSLPVALARGVVALGQPDDPSWLSVDVGSALRDNEAAVAAFTAATKLDGNNMEAVAGLATALRMSGKLGEVDALLAKLRPSLRASAPVLVELAMCAIERDEFEAAQEHIRLALEDDPTSMHAEVVRLELLRRTERGSQRAIDHARSLVRNRANAVTLQWHGLALLDRAFTLSQDSLVLEGQRELDRSMATGPVIPGAVHAISHIHIRNGEIAAALKLVDLAILNEPTSPQLQLSRAEVMSAAGEPPQTRLDTYRRVLELEPRGLEARIEVVRALINLDRTAEAKEIIDAMVAELPGNSIVTMAASWLLEPWQMPPSHAIGTRIDRPWADTRQDDPEYVLDLLTAEIVNNLRLSPDAEGRLRDRVKADRATVLQRAAKEEQDYLGALEVYQAADERAKKGAVLRYLGYLLTGLGVVAVAAAFGLLAWLVTSLVGLPVGWRLVLIGALFAVLIVIAAVNEFGDYYVDIFPFYAAIAIVSVIAASIWQAILSLGVGAGIVGGIVLSVVIGGAVGGGAFLASLFEKPGGYGPQRAFNSWLESLYGNGLLPEAIRASSPPSAYSTWLPANARTVSDAPVDIDTQAAEELQQLLRQRSRGSFALAGPRGAGKSTLLERWCAGQFLRDPGGEQRTRRDLTMKVDAPVDYQSKEFVAHLFGKLCDAVEDYAGKHDAAIQKLMSQRPSRSSLLDRARGVEQSFKPRDLGRMARDEREKLRYLMSRTTEGELSIGAPPVAGTTVGFKKKVAVRRDDVPLNHPELVDRFRAFLGTAADVVGKLQSKVLIGIDELDRITDGDKAQRFLNDLKAIFNVPNCYFLVSVSEDALADFELSAMGMRTVFDSAFDTIVRVDYLRFDQAKVLLNRRIMDLPEQFAALAYALSGGLARELARTAEVMGGHRSTEKQELGAVTRRLVQRRLSHTTRAAIDRLSRLSGDQAARAQLISLLDDQPVDALTGELLRSYAAALTATIPTTPKPDTPEPDTLNTVRFDVIVMVEYLAVLLDVFNDQLDETRMATGLKRGPGDFEALARARRYLGAHPHGARALLRDFCKTWHLASCTSLPKESAAAPQSAPVTPVGRG